MKKHTPDPLTNSRERSGLGIRITLLKVPRRPRICRSPRKDDACGRIPRCCVETGLPSRSSLKLERDARANHLFQQDADLRASKCCSHAKMRTMPESHVPRLGIPRDVQPIGIAPHLFVSVRRREKKEDAISLSDRVVANLGVVHRNTSQRRDWRDPAEDLLDSVGNEFGIIRDLRPFPRMLAQSHNPTSDRRPRCFVARNEQIASECNEAVGADDLRACPGSCEGREATSLVMDRR